MRIEINKYIVADSEICHGKPTFKGTRIMVYLIIEMLENGSSEKEIFEAYPSLSKKHIKAALSYAVALIKEQGVAIANLPPLTQKA